MSVTYDAIVLHIFATSANLTFSQGSTLKIKITPLTKIYGCSQRDKLRNLTDEFDVGDILQVSLNSGITRSGNYTVNNVDHIVREARHRSSRSIVNGVVESFNVPSAEEYPEEANIRIAGDFILPCDTRSVFVLDYNQWSVKQLDRILYIGCTVSVVFIKTATKKVVISVTPLTEIQDVEEGYGRIIGSADSSHYIIRSDTLNTDVYLSKLMLSTNDQRLHLSNGSIMHFQVCRTFPKYAQPYSALYAHPKSACSIYHTTSGENWIENCNTIKPSSYSRSVSSIVTEPQVETSNNFSSAATAVACSSSTMFQFNNTIGASSPEKILMKEPDLFRVGLVENVLTSTNNAENSFNENVDEVAQMCEEIMSDDDDYFVGESTTMTSTESVKNDPKEIMFYEMLNFIESFNQLALNDDQVWNIISEKDPLLLAKGLKIMKKNYR